MLSTRNSCRSSSVYFVILLCLAHGLKVTLADVIVGASCQGDLPGIKYPNAENCRTYIVCNAGVYEIWYCPSGFYNSLKYDCDLDYKCQLDSIPEGTTAIMPDESTRPDVLTTLYDQWISTTQFPDESATAESPSTTSESPTTTQGSITRTTEEDTTVDVSEHTITPTLGSTATTEVDEQFTDEITTTEGTMDVSSTFEESSTVETSTKIDETTPEFVTTTTPPTTSTEQSTMSPITTTSTITTATMATTTATLPVDPYNCPLTDSFEPIFLSHKQNCEKYYLCYHSKPVELHCLTGMYWDGETKMCDYPMNVKCPTDGNTGDANPLPKCNSAGLYSMPHPSRCEYFIMCMDGLQTIQQCDAFHRWDVIDQKCVIKDRARCILDITHPDRKDK